MENNESNFKPQSTGGLKLMTVFIVVLALHVLVIGGVTVYHLMSGGGADTDLTDNKTSKDAKVAADGSVATDSQLPDGSQPDKTTASESTTSAPAIEQTTPAETAPTSAPATVAAAPNALTPTGPVVTPSQPSAPEPTTAAESTVSAGPTVATESTEPTSAPPMEPEVPVAPMVSGSYVVKMHDTLEKIAHRHHTTMAKLKAANGLHGELLHVGERLVIPGKTEVAAISATYTTGATVLSGTPATTPDETVAAPALSHARASHHTYTVVKGDTLTRIARRFRTTTKALMAANNITDPTRLGIGKKLKIPSREAQVQARTTTTPARTITTPATTTVTPVPAPDAVQPEETKTTAQLANFVQ